MNVCNLIFPLLTILLQFITQGDGKAQCILDSHPETVKAPHLKGSSSATCNLLNTVTFKFRVTKVSIHEETGPTLQSLRNFPPEATKLKTARSREVRLCCLPGTCLRSRASGIRRELLGTFLGQWGDLRKWGRQWKRALGPC